MARHHDVEIHPERNPVLKLLQRVMPVTPRYAGDRLLVSDGGRRVGTPLLAALALVATFDVVFAVDSIPAIFAVTRETFIVFAANAFSLLGLGALYFVLAGMIGRFRFLNVGLAAVTLGRDAAAGAANPPAAPPERPARTSCDIVHARRAGRRRPRVAHAERRDTASPRWRG
jgi:hypothetical protein